MRDGSMATMTRPHAALVRATWQPILFGPPNRADLAECIPSWPLRTLRVRVHRNHGFEPISSATLAFGAWNGLAFEWTIGAYDDSLAFDLHADADVDVLWLDTTRIALAEGEALGRWIASRILALRAQTDNPIVVLAWPLDESARAVVDGASIPDVWVADLSQLQASLRDPWLDPRAETISGTKLGNRACLHIARELACKWLPAAALPPCKAIAIDLDDTLYRGVLGEEGVGGVVLAEGHRELQQRLRALRESGILLALVSRNERSDVEELFARREDFPLRVSDFITIEASWNDKVAALAKVATQLRIAPDAMVFVDDNAGELASIASSLPVFTVHAQGDARMTATAIDHVAGMFRWRQSHEDRIRAHDLRASTVRAELLQTAKSNDDYLRSLDVVLDFLVGDMQHVSRLAQLSAKTNQFNLALRRINEAEIVRRIRERPADVIAIRLADRLSDSGIIGLVAGAREDDVLRVDELCISCRALGRRLEDSMVTKALAIMAGHAAPRQVRFALRKGTRNAPAREWLARYADCVLDENSSAVEIPFARVATSEISPAIRLNVIQ
ncbi:MAG TPA: HAD-IIIC family phosphatase [Casimicrobiaceae bacterium]|nr:HAD-IIIC family phosphatase [Casimicrobiaceae bacterium]